MKTRSTSLLPFFLMIKARRGCLPRAQHKRTTFKVYCKNTVKKDTEGVLKMYRPSVEMVQFSVEHLQFKIETNQYVFKINGTFS